jgi:hypothetical protein
VVREAVNSSLNALKELTEYSYEASGGTPLFDAVGEAINILKAVPDYNSEDVSFLVMVITDGEENGSSFWKSRLGSEIKKLQGTDRWTFTFRVPRGYARALESLGIPGGNILEWDQTEAGFQVATNTTRSAVANYYTQRTLGAKSIQTFYTDLKGVSTQDLKAAHLVDIQTKVEIFKNGADVQTIREFCEKRTKKPFLKGAAFYELIKPEKEVQDYKQIVIRDRTTGSVYAGPAARQLLGLPNYGTVKLVPGDHSKYDVFVQSTSTNRKLTPHTRVLYYEAVGVPYTEGPSAPWSRR